MLIWALIALSLDGRLLIGTTTSRQPYMYEEKPTTNRAAAISSKTMA
jgi:hypothetical protein